MDEYNTGDFMDFCDAWKLMLRGCKVRRYHWKGYWAWSRGTIMMYCESGEVIDIRHTDNVEYTMGNILAGDWVVADDHD